MPPVRRSGSTRIQSVLQGLDSKVCTKLTPYQWEKINFSSTAELEVEQVGQMVGVLGRLLIFFLSRSCFSARKLTVRRSGRPQQQVSLLGGLSRSTPPSIKCSQSPMTVDDSRGADSLRAEACKLSPRRITMASHKVSWQEGQSDKEDCNQD